MANATKYANIIAESGCYHSPALHLDQPKVLYMSWFEKKCNPQYRPTEVLAVRYRQPRPKPEFRQK